MRTFVRYGAASLALLLLWWAASLALGDMLLPAPLDVAAGLVDAALSGELSRHAGVSTLRLIEGLGAAVLFGYPIGLWLGHSERADWLGAPLAFITYPLPKIVLLPVFFTLVGLGDASRVLLITLTAGYQILVIVRAEARALDPAYKLALRSMGAGRADLLRHVVLPASLPSLFTALRVASGTAVAVLFLAESFATDAGLGWLIMDAWGMGDILRMFVGILAISLLGVALYAAIGIAERRVCAWHHSNAS